MNGTFNADLTFNKPGVEEILNTTPMDTTKEYMVLPDDINTTVTISSDFNKTINYNQSVEQILNITEKNTSVTVNEKNSSISEETLNRSNANQDSIISLLDDTSDNKDQNGTVENSLNLNSTATIAQESPEKLHTSHEVASKEKEISIISLLDDTQNNESQNQTSERIDTTNEKLDISDKKEIMSNPLVLMKGNDIISLLDDTWNNEDCQNRTSERVDARKESPNCHKTFKKDLDSSKSVDDQSKSHAGFETFVAEKTENVSFNLIQFSMLDETLNKTVAEDQESKSDLVSKNDCHPNRRQNFSESYSEALFTSALSSSVLEKFSPSSSAQNEKRNAENAEILRKSRPDTPHEKITSDTARISLALKRVARIDGLPHYSPARSDLAAAFENLKINSTTDETFVSCDNHLEFSAAENQKENMDISSENECSFKSPENLSQAPEKELVISANSDGKIDSEKGAEEIVETCSEDNSPTKAEEDDIQKNVNTESPVPDAKFNVAGRKSTSYYISDMQLAPSPSPFREKLSHLDDELFNELLSASPSVLKEKMPQYQKYSQLKLEINSLQQEIAKLNLEFKQKEEQIIRLRPNNAKQRPNIKPREIIPKDTSHISPEIVELQNTNTTLKEEIRELHAKLWSVETQLQNVTEENSNLKASLMTRESELQTAQNQISKLENIMKNFEDIVTMSEKKMAEGEQKLAEAQNTNKKMQEFNDGLQNAFGQLADKYEKTKAVLLGMKSNEEYFKKRVKDLETVIEVLKKQ